MSSTVDNRVVELGFDNSKFERGVSTSLGTLQKLNDALNKSNSSKGLSNLADSVKRFDASPMVNAVQQISDRFTTLGIIGVTALENITNRAVNAGIALAKSLSIDQVTAGWQKYADKTTAVATIINNAKKELTGEAYAIEEVSDQLDKLNWFTDETSYNFVDMVSNIGKFTSQGQSLEKANIAMQGIATWAAVSGQNANAASRAMYNMSQALGVGAVKLMDWKSIQNANMATEEFKQTAIETAVAIGTLTEKEGHYFTTTKNTEVSIQSFDQTLQEAWFSADVLMATLEKYGSFGGRLAEVTEELDVTATDFLKGITEFQNGPDSSGYIEWLKEMGLTSSKITPYMEELTSSEYELGLKAFKAAQEARTFRDAIDAIKDGVSTSWMNLFETLFGNYEEAKKLWTGLANEGYEIFAEPINKLDSWLSRIKDNGYFKYLGDSFKNLGDLAKSIVSPIRKSFFNVFPNGLKITTTQVDRFIMKFNKFTKSLKLSDSAISNIGKAFNGLFSVIKFSGNIIRNLLKYLKPLFPAFVKLGGAILGVAGKFGDWLTEITNSKNELPLISSIINGIASAITWFSNILSNFSVSNAFGTAIDFIKEQFSKLGDFLANLKDTVGPIDWGKLIFGGLGAGLLASITKFISNLTLSFSGIKNVFAPLTGILSNVAQAFRNFGSMIGAANIKKIATGILLLAVALTLLSSIEPEKLNSGLIGMAKMMFIVGAAMVVLTAAVSSFKSSAIRNLNKASTALIKISVAVLVLAIAIRVFEKIDPEKLGTALLAMAGSLAIVVAAIFALSAMKGKLISGAVAIGIISVALIVLAAALGAFILVAKYDWKGALGVMAASLGLIVLALFLLSDFGVAAITGSVAILIVAGALVVLASAFMIMAMVPADSLSNSLEKIALALGAIVLAIAIVSALGPKAIVAAAAIFAVSAALVLGAAAFLIFAIAANAFVPALQAMNDIGFGTIALGLIEFAGAMFVMSLVGAIAGALSPLLIAFSLALLILAPALTAFSAAVVNFESMDLLTIAEGLAAIAGALGLFDVALAILTPLSPVLAVAAKSFEKLGTAGLNAGTGADMFANALQTISDSGSSFITIGPQITTAVKTMLKELSSSFSEATPELQAFEPLFLQLGTNLGTQLTNGLKVSLTVMLGVVRSMLMSAKFAVSGQYQSFYQAGAYAGQGIVNGLASMWQACYNMGASLAQAANQGFRNNLQINSPSRVMFRDAVYAGLGVVNGGLSMISAVRDAFGKVGNAADEGFSNAISRLSEAISSDIDVNPTITPVLDLSEIQNGANSINGMFGKSSISLNGTVNRARTAYVSDDTNSAIEQQTPAAGTVNNFVQNNYSPKALSRIDIYRQTKNLISAKVG